jgi:hypothetical protein
MKGIADQQSESAQENHELPDPCENPRVVSPMVKRSDENIGGGL